MLWFIDILPGWPLLPVALVVFSMREWYIPAMRKKTPTVANTAQIKIPRRSGEEIISGAGAVVVTYI